MEARIHWIDLNRIKILSIDYSYILGENQMLNLFQKGIEMVKNTKEKYALIINFTNTHASKKFNQYARKHGKLKSIESPVI